MARPLRIEYPGAWYHVMNRGRKKEPIFFQEKDYELFLSTLQEAHRLFQLKVHAYSLMPNHYHLLVHTPKGNLSRGMRHLNGVYTQKINQRIKQDGSLFRGRYKSIVVEKEGYLLELVRYIHRNAYKAGIEKEIGEYKWNSHRAYMMKNERPEWLQTDEVLNLFSEYEKEAKMEMDSFVKKDGPTELLKKLDSVRWPVFLGGNGKIILKRERIRYCGVSCIFCFT